MSNSLLLVCDGPKLPDDSGDVSKPKGVIDGWISDRELVCLLDEKVSQVVKRLMCSNNKYINIIITTI